MRIPCLFSHVEYLNCCYGLFYLFSGIYTLDTLRFVQSKCQVDEELLIKMLVIYFYRENVTSSQRCLKKIYNK